MCRICKSVLSDFSIEHTETRCPLRNSRYCNICAQYGHLTTKCPVKPSRLFCKPVYLEQLICPTDLIAFNITTQTLLPSYTIEEPQRLLEIKDDDKLISAYLSSKSIKPTKGCTKRYLLEEYAKTQNRRVIYIK